MQHVQLKLNMDGTICMDLYEDELYTTDVAETLKKTADYIELHNDKKIRRFPFSITKCKHCEHLIVTNRDYLDTIKCQNCTNEYIWAPISSEMNRELLTKIHKTFGYELQECVGYEVYMLAFFPKGIEPSLSSQIMKHFGFQPEHCEGEIYDKLLKLGIYKGWMTKDCLVGFGKTILDEEDTIFDGVIPRIEACARAIEKNTYNQVKTISIHVPPQTKLWKEKITSHENMKKKIEQYVAEGRMDEAMKLMELL